MIKPKRLMQKPLLERSYVEKCCRNHGKRYSELPKAITWFAGEVESCCCFSNPFGITSCNLVCIVLILVRCESSGSQKACRCSQKADSCSKRPPRSRARTSDHRTCCQNLSRRRFWKAETVLEKPSFTFFLLLPDEFIQSQTDNLAITQNCEKGPRAARDPIHPWSGVETCTCGGLARPSLALKPNIEYSFDLKIQRDEQNLQKQKACKRARTKLFWGKILAHSEDEQWTADCWPWSAHIVDSVEMHGMDLQINSHCLICSKRTQIDIANDLNQ